MPQPRRRTADKAAKGALIREIPDTSMTESITGAATVDEIDLSDVENGGTPGNGTSVLDRWVYVTPIGASVYMRRFSGTAPNSASMQAGRLYADGETQEFFIDGGIGRTELAVEGTAACELVFEFGSGT